MKLIRSQIASELNDRLFNISAKILPERGIVFLEDKIKCTISSKIIDSGFSIWGKIRGKNKYFCIRCLEPYPNTLNINFKVMLSHKKDSTNQDTLETIFFHPSEEKINLGDFIADRISLDEPMKPICDSNCKGLCTQCGVNINKSSCDCKLDETDSPWDELKKIDFNLK